MLPDLASSVRAQDWKWKRQQTFAVDGKRLIFVEDVVAANVAVFGRAVGVVGFHLDDLVGRPPFVHVDDIGRLVEFRCVLVDVIDADVHRGAAYATNYTFSTADNLMYRRRRQSVNKRRAAFLCALAKMERV